MSLKTYILLIGIFFSSSQIVLSADADFVSQGKNCSIFQKNGLEIKCEKKWQTYEINKGDSIHTNYPINVRKLNDRVNIYHKIQNGIHIYEIKEREKISLNSIIKYLLSNINKVYDKKNVLAYSRAGVNRNLKNFNPSISFIYPDEEISFLLKKTSYGNFKLYIYQNNKEENKQIIEFKVYDMGDYYKIVVNPTNLERDTFYTIRIEDDLGPIDNIKVLVINNNFLKELKNKKKIYIKNISYPVNNSLKEALFYAKTGNLLKARDILIENGIFDLEKANLDEKYKEKIKNYLFDLDFEN